MTRHVLISTDPDILARWAAAFPDAVSAVDSGTARMRAGPGSIVWLHRETAAVVSIDQLVGTVRVLSPARVVALSTMPNDDDALACLAAGTSGYAHAYASAPVLQQIATVVTNGGLWVGPDLMKRLLAATQGALPTGPTGSDNELDSLSGREREVAIAVGRGLSNKEVARELAITERTVKAHLGSVFAKLGARDRLHLALRLKGLIDDRPPATDERV